MKSHAVLGKIQVLRNGPKVKLYTGQMCTREMLKNFIISQKAHYLYSEIVTYMSSGKGLKETIWKTKEKRMRTELRI